MVVTIVRTLVFTFYISPENFGLTALSASFVGLISLLKDFGYTTYIIQQKELNEAELVAINTRVLLLGIAAFLITWIFVYPISNFYDQVELMWILPITGSLFIVNSFTLVPQALMRRNMEFDKIGKIEVGSNLAAVILGVIMLAFDRSYWVILMISILYSFFQVLFTSLLSTWRHQFSNPFQSKLSKTGSVFGFRLMAFNVMTFLSLTVDNILIGKVGGPAVLGNYTKSFEFGNSNIDRLIRKPVMQVYFSDLSGKSQDEKCRLFFQYLFLLLSLLTLIVGPALVCLEWIITTLLSSEWQSLIKMLPPFLICTFFWMTMSLADQLLITPDNLKKYLFLGLVKAITGTAAVVIASFWGAEAIAWAFLIYHVVLFIPFCYVIFSRMNNGDQSVTKKLLINTCVIVATATLTAVLPFMLRYYHVINMITALIGFLILFIILQFAVWPRIKHFESFKLFFKGLISFKKIAVA